MIDPFAMDPPETLATERLSLRLAELEDAEELLELITMSASHLKPFVDWAALDYELDEVMRRIRRTRAFFANRDSFEWLLWHRSSGELLGAVDLHSFQWSIRRCEFGFWLGRNAQGHGYVAEAGAAVLAWAAQHFWRIEARCETANTRSQASLTRLGFTLEGRLRRNMRNAAGQPTDENVYSILPAIVDSTA